MRTKILCFPGARNSFGNKSVKAVMKLSTRTNWVKQTLLVPFPVGRYQLRLLGWRDSCITCVSTVRRVSIRKKQTLQNRGSVIMAVAWGYAMKAGPGRSSRRAGSAEEPLKTSHSSSLSVWGNASKAYQFTRFYHGVDANTLFFSRQQIPPQNWSHSWADKAETETVPGGHGKLKTHCHCNNFSSDSNTHL